MKNKILSAFAVAVGAIVLVSCADSLERIPKTEITAKDYFKTAGDLEGYTNGLYESFLTVPWDNSGSDSGSDNITLNTNATDMYTMVNSDGISTANVGGWGKDDWDELRKINFMLDNIRPEEMDISEADLNHYVGIARYFRGLFYFNKVKKYSAVPLYLTTLEADSEELYKASDPRELVMAAVIEDLEYAGANIKPALGERTRLNKYTALALLSRVCLYEGTYRKYHTELGLTSSADGLLQKAAGAAGQIVSSGEFEISGSSAADFTALFCSSKLTGNKEVIMTVEYDQAMGRGSNAHIVLGEYWGLSRSLMEAFQMADGSDFVPTKADGSYKSYVEIFEGRDPRFAETFVHPGFKTSPEIASQTPYRPKITYGGYGQLKFYPRETSQRGGWGMDYTSFALFRYAEVLLNLAEAKAELGTISQADLDGSVNLVRARVGMPAITMSDDVLEDIRRERRVELACEGFRQDDLKRWALGELLGEQPQGIYVAGVGAYDVTGDGVPDMAILPNPSDRSSIASLPQSVQDALTIEYLADDNGAPTSIYLNGADGKSGYMQFRTAVNRKWNDKFYYTPIPDRQIQLNGNLIQPPGWN